MKLSEKKQEVQETEIMEGRVIEEEFTEEETGKQLLLSEEEIIQGLISAADFKTETRKEIEIVRNGKVYFRFRVQPLTEEEYQKCREKHTTYKRNKNIGIKFAESTNSSKYRDALIYKATVPEDREKLWDNKKVWNALINKEIQIMNGLDVIEYTLMAGEKERVIDVIDSISGYENQLEEVVKN